MSKTILLTNKGQVPLEFNHVALAASEHDLMLSELVVLDVSLGIHEKLSIDEDTILVSPKEFNCISKDVEMIAITSDMNNPSYLDYRSMMRN